MLRSCLHFGIMVCFLTGCQQKPDSRSETGPPNETADSLTDHAAAAGATDTAKPDELGDLPVKDMQPTRSRSSDVEAEKDATLGQIGEIQLAEERFRELDKRIALLEVTVFGEDLGRPFEDAISRLYVLRNEVALSLAEAETAPPEEFQRRKDHLLDAIDKLDTKVKLMARATGNAGGNPDEDLANRIWL